MTLTMNDKIRNIRGHGNKTYEVIPQFTNPTIFDLYITKNKKRNWCFSSTPYELEIVIDFFFINIRFGDKFELVGHSKTVSLFDLYINQDNTREKVFMGNTTDLKILYDFPSSFILNEGIESILVNDYQKIREITQDLKLYK